MRIEKYVVVCAVVMMVFGSMIGTTYGAPSEEGKKDWNISFLGTMQVPDQLEIVDGKDVILEMVKIDEKAKKEHPVKVADLKAKTFSPQEITEAFEKNNIGVYQFALKNHGSYNTAFVFVGKLPAQYNVNGVTFFDTLKNMNRKKQEEVHKMILKGIGDVYAKDPELKNVFDVEILEFYPFKQIDNENAKIVSVGGSLAVRTFKLVQPFAFKTYIVNKNSEIYIFTILDSGSDRKIWDKMTKEMLKTAQWK